MIVLSIAVGESVDRHLMVGEERKGTPTVSFQKLCWNYKGITLHLGGRSFYPYLTVTRAKDSSLSLSIKQSLPKSKTWLFELRHIIWDLSSSIISLALAKYSNLRLFCILILTSIKLMIPPNCGHLKKGHQFCYDGGERWREEVLQWKVDALDPSGTRQEYPPRVEVV